MIGFGVPALESVVAATSDAVLRDFVAAHVPVDWNAIAALGQARSLLVYRLVGLEVMRQLLAAFDAAHGLRLARIPIGYSPNFKTRPRLRSQCPPTTRATCESIEAILDAHERAWIRSWRNAGYDRWFQEILGNTPDGAPSVIADSAPSFDAFRGVVALVDFGPPVAGYERGDLMSNTVASLAAAVGGMPVVIAPRGAPLETVVTGAFCEASICPSAFSAYYRAYEPAIQTMLSRFAPGQVKNFAIPTFEGAHFDIRQPYERYEGFSLNRVGETGFNNPLLNLYSAR